MMTQLSVDVVGPHCSSMKSEAGSEVSTAADSMVMTPTDAPKKRSTGRSARQNRLLSGVTTFPIAAGVDGPALAAAAALDKLGDVDEPLMLLDLGQVRAKLEEWCAHMPRVRPHYAVKCNPDKKLVQVLQDGGCGFDCATMNELQIALSRGATPDDIVFSHPCKPRSHIKFAKEHGVKLMSFDNQTELRKVAAEFPAARLLLRLVCEDAHAQCPMSMKFGAARPDWPALVDCAAELGLQIAGVSFHVGSGCTDPAAFERALTDARDVFELGKSKGFHMDVLDIGGGFPGVDGPEVTFAAIAATVNKQLLQFFPMVDFPNLRVIAEPGRFFACSSAVLLTKVIAKACVAADGEGSESSSTFRYYLNDGLYGSFNCVLYDHAEVLPEMLRDAEGPRRRCCMFGPTCDGFDMILKEAYFPELQEGDWLMWRDMGAYTSAAGSKFNGFPSARTWYYIAEDRVQRGKLVGGPLAHY